MKIPSPQKQQSLTPRDYEHRIIVAGSRGFKDIQLFHRVVCAYLESFDAPVLFISGAAPTGADHLIIQWCKKFGYPCLEMPAEWETLGEDGIVTKNRGAGFIRNTKMAELGTDLIAFFDGKSPGTTHMIDTAMKKGLCVKVLTVTL